MAELKAVADVSVVAQQPEDLFGRAAIIGAARPGAFPVSFTSVALAFFAARDPFSRWVARTGASTGKQIQRFAKVTDQVMYSARIVVAPSTSLSVSPSVGAVLREAQAIATAVGESSPQPHLIFAAYCFGKVGHGKDFDVWKFDRQDWTRKLLAWIGLTKPSQLRAWLIAAGWTAPSRSPWSVWKVRRNANGQCEVPALLDAMVASGKPAIAEIVAARRWKSVGPLHTDDNAGNAFPLSPEAELWTDLGNVLSYPDQVVTTQALLAAAVAAPAGVLPSVSAWLSQQGKSVDDESSPVWDWVASHPTRNDWWPIREIWSDPGVPPVAGFDNDEARGGDDRLEFNRDVAALAQLLSASEDRGVRPPLSIGLFGEWGTGKTFFMDMLERKVDELKASGEAAFCERIVQIRFNAWHYMDTNLWASLAVHLFDELNLKLANGEPDDQRERRTNEVLASAREERTRVEAERSTLQAQLATLHRLALQEETFRRERRLAMADVRAADIKSVLMSDPELAKRMRAFDDAARTLSTARAFFSRYTIGFLILTAIALVVGLYVGSVVLKDVAAALGGVISTVAGVVGAVRRAVPRSEQLVALVAELENKARARPSAEEERLGQEIAAADIRYQELVGACTRLTADIARLEVEAKQLSDGRNFAKYILQRNQSDDYRKQLGIVSMLQRDFDELSHRFLVDDSGQRLQRIVLYIDDLDRCPAEKVVQVLQAVHLLLSFQLFVVVVAVDPTWVLRSLEAYYARQMVDPGEQVPATTPHAYLEKIFQIPVRVRPMSLGSYRRLVTAIAGKHVVKLAPTGPEVREGLVDGLEASEAQTTAIRDGDVQDRRLAAIPEMPPTGEALTLNSHEVEYLESLGALIPTPRAAKRLVNVYRLIRVLQTQRERVMLTDSKTGSYRALMLFLAMSARFPGQSTMLFREIASRSSVEWTQFEDMMARKIPNWSEVQLVVHRGADSPTQVSNAFLVSMPWREIQRTAALAARFSLPNTSTALADGPRT